MFVIRYNYKYCCNIGRYSIEFSPTILVKEGESVSCGDYIGAVFTIPSEIMDEVHLHLTAKKDGKLIDAQAVLEKNA